MLKAAIEQVRALHQVAAQSLYESLRVYWPADEYDRNDPGERNVSLHFAHAMIAAKFAVFGEAWHSAPLERKSSRIDLLGISPNCSWFLACEFKRLFAKHYVDLAFDIEKLSRFSLNSKLKSDSCGELVARVATHCKLGVGLVGGLCSSTINADLIEFWRGAPPKRKSIATIEQKLTQRNGICLPPLHVQTYPTGSNYYLLVACFPIEHRNISLRRIGGVSDAIQPPQ